MKKRSIYIFTCNRPAKLERILHELCSNQGVYDVYIIDDSCRSEAVKENKRMASKYRYTTYLGAMEYKDFYSLQNDYLCSSSLGDNTWNLGIARNFALDHSIYKESDKVLFVDDDMSGIELEYIEHGFTLLTKFCFVSCRLICVEDNSIIGHIAKEVGVVDGYPKMLSGGLLFLVPTSISHRFFNVYNEDWIMQLLEKDKEQIVLPYSVIHNIEQDQQWTIEQAVFQELGELIVCGLFENAKALTFDNDFWDGILKKRINFIESIEEAALINENKFGHDVCGRLLFWLKKQNGESLRQLIELKINE